MKVCSTVVFNLLVAHCVEEVTLASVKKQISDDEHQQAVQGKLQFSGLKITAGDFLVEGLNLEEQQ
jgi:hypothetical protein